MKLILSPLLLALSEIPIQTISSNPWNPKPPTVAVTNGTIQGLHLPAFDEDIFLSIPFAAPPVGDLRFRHPQPFNSTWNGVLKATVHRPSCPGYGGLSEGLPFDEDCLTLDVVRPAGINLGDGLPVMVWIYGGGFLAGASADPKYNLSYIVNASVAINKPVLAVGINYRLAGFGFLAGQDVFNSGNSNAGLHDQRLALRWVQENIAAFGGDPKKVTIWGESAGAISVGFHLIANNGNHEGLFRAAIMQSGSNLGLTLYSLGFYDKMYKNLTDTVGCTNSSDRLQCLREVPYEQLFEIMSPQIWRPVIDGDIIPRWPSDMMKEGDFADVAILTGANTDEGTATFFGPRNLINTDEDLYNYLLNGPLPAITPSSADAIFKLYPDDPALGCPFNTGSERFASQGYQYKRSAAIVGDYFMHAGRRHICEYYTGRGKKVYSYRFDQVPWDERMEFITTVAPVYATHYAEIGFVFNNPSRNITTYVGPDPKVQELSTLMSRSWISFAHDLDPNNHGVKGAPEWPEYKVSASNMVFNSNRSYMEKDDFRKEQLELWKTIWYELGC